MPKLELGANSCHGVHSDAGGASRGPTPRANRIHLLRRCRTLCCAAALLRFGLPEADPEIVHTFYPLLAGAIMEAQLRSDDEGDAEDGTSWVDVLDFTTLSQYHHDPG